MTSVPVEPPTLRSFTSTSTTASNRRSYSCYNCNHAFHITPIAATSSSADSPSSFRCPRCLHRHLIPHHTVAPPPPPPPPYISNYTPLPPGAFTYYTPDDFDSDYDEEDEEDSSGLSFTIPNYSPSLPALKSFIDSLPIKTFSPNSAAPPPVASCSICMEDFAINLKNCEIVNELPCQHCFHKDCIAEWLNRSNTCPLCRYKLPVDPGPEYLESGEYDTVFVVESVMRRSDAEVSLTSVAAAAAAEASGSDRRVVGSSSGMMRRRSNAEASFISVAAAEAEAEAEASGADRRVGSTNSGGEGGEWGFDAMRDADGDTLMVDAV